MTDKRRTEVSYHLCLAHFRAIENLNLAPKDFRALKTKLGGISFNIHEDFYGTDGTAVQPRRK